MLQDKIKEYFVSMHINSTHMHKDIAEIVEKENQELKEEIEKLRAYKEWADKELNSNGDGTIKFLKHGGD